MKTALANSFKAKHGEYPNRAFAHEYATARWGVVLKSAAGHRSAFRCESKDLALSLVSQWQSI